MLMMQREWKLSLTSLLINNEANFVENHSIESKWDILNLKSQQMC